MKISKERCSVECVFVCMMYMCGYHVYACGTYIYMYGI